MICDRLKECVEKQSAGEYLKKCGNIESECIKSNDCRSKVVCTEKSKKYSLDNTQKNMVISYEVDGGMIRLDKTVPPETVKCDYLYVICREETEAILIELKGTDIVHSLKQIEGTLSHFKSFFDLMSHVYGRAVVVSSTPNLLANPHYVKLKNKLKNYGGNLKIRERLFAEKDTELRKD